MQSFLAYVTHSDSPIVSVVDADTNVVVSEIQMDGVGRGVTATPNGQRVGIANFPNVVTILDTATNMVERVVRAESPVAIASSLDSQRFYVARFDAASNSIRAVVSVIDARTGEEVAAIPAGEIEGNREPALGITVPSMGIATSPDGKHAFVVAGNADGGTLAVIDIASNTSVSTIKTGRLDQRAVAVGLAISPDGTRAFVPSGQALAVLDTAAAAVVDFINVGEVSGVAIAPDGRHLYATHAGAINVIDLVASSNPVRISLPSAGGGIACTPDGRLVYVASRKGSVLAIEAATNGVIANIPVSGPAEAIAIAAIRK